MSNEIACLKNTGVNQNKDMNITTFCGGKSAMLQITQGFGTVINNDEPGFIQLSVKDCYILVQELVKFIQTESKKQAGTLRKEIEKNKDLEKTIVKEAAECERFIDELKIINIPLRLLGKI